MSRLTSSTCEKTCDIPLDGEITGLHLVDSETSGERILVGGADDGSIALWSLE